MRCPARVSALATLAWLALSWTPACTARADQVLATVGEARITSTDLERALASSPFATQFPRMGEGQQARLRGDMLTRLVDAEVLRLEAIAEGIDRSEAFKSEVEAYRTGLLYQRFLAALREEVAIPKDVERSLRERYRGNSDALAAARATYTAGRYEQRKEARLEVLKRRYHVRVFEERLAGEPAPETVVLAGDGIRIPFSAIAEPPAGLKDRDVTAARRQRLEEQAEVVLGAKAAEEAGLLEERQLRAYRRTLLARLLIERKESEWAPDRWTLRDYFQRHPEVGYIPERRHVGQLVVATRREAESLRQRVLAGESLFELAGRYSIDPVGREQAGDMGWLREGSGMPELEAVLTGLVDGEISPVVKTAKGYHLLVIIGRKPAQRKPFAAIEDRVKRAVIAENLPGYLHDLRARYPVEWRLPDHRAP